MSDNDRSIKPAMVEEFDKDFLDYMRVVLLELRNHNPFFGILATEMWIAGPTNSISTIGVSQRGVVVYNEKFMKGLKVGELIAVLVHEALHVALDYWERFDGKDPEIANWAHDFAINDIIITGLGTLHIKRQKAESTTIKIELPKGGLYDKKYSGASGEEIYIILDEGVRERTKQIREKILNQLQSTGTSAQKSRDDKINRELRKSVIDGLDVVTQKKDRIKKELGRIKDLDVERSDFRDLIQSHQGFDFSAPTEDVDRANNNPFERDADPSNNKGAGSFENKPLESSSHTHTPQPDKPQQSENQQPPEGDQGNPEDAQADQGPAPEQNNPFDEANEKLNKEMLESFQDYIEKEKERISDKVDGKPESVPQKQNLDAMSDKMDQVADDYIKDVTKAREEGYEEPGEQSDKTQEGQSQPGQPGDESGEPAEGAGQPGQGQGDGQGQPGQGQPGQGQPGQGQGQGSQPGQGQGDGQGQPGQGQGSEPGQGQGDGQGQPGQGQGSQPGQGQGQGQGDGQGQPGQPDQGQGSQPGQGQGQGQGDGQGQPGQGQGGQPGAGAPDQGQSMSEGKAKSNVADALENLQKDLENALRGKPNGSGLDGDMASGQDMMANGAWDRAMKELAEEMGVGGMQGDINIDCSDIQGNPFKSEDKQKTKERKRQMLQQAVREDLMNGGNGWGSMPNWAKSEIQGILNPPLRFTEKIKKTIGNYGRPDQSTFKRRNKRNSFGENTPLLPGKKKNTSRVYILMDTSGSMFGSDEDVDNLRMAMGLVKNLARSKGMEVLVVQCDAGVTQVMTTQEALKSIDKRRFDVVGKGGSDFTEGFELIWKEMKDKDPLFGAPIIVFTDGGITVPAAPPKNLPRHQTLWITTPGQNAPTKAWGEHVIMKDL
jgi:predicted metal-dependent peptidase